MTEETIKEQADPFGLKTKKESVICIIMCYAYKWMFVAGLVSLIALFIAVIFSWCITGEDEAGRWGEIWMMATLLELTLCGLAAIATHWKDVYNWVRDELRCA